MKFMFLPALILFASLAGCGQQVTDVSDGREKFILAGGGPNGTYIQFARQVCKVVNASSKNGRYRCIAETSSGGYENLKNLRSGKIDAGIVLSTWLYDAHNGTRDFLGQQRQPNLRALFGLNTDALTVVARNAEGNDGISDLLGKRIGVGPSGSYSNYLWKEIRTAEKIGDGDIIEIERSDDTNTFDMFCSGELDAVSFFTGHPSRITDRLIDECDGRVLRIAGAEIDRLILEKRYYRESTIRVGDTGDGVRTIGLAVVVAVNSSLSDDAAYLVSQGVFEAIDALKSSHPGLEMLEPSMMSSAGLGVPLHSGSEQYLRDAGIL